MGDSMMRAFSQWASLVVSMDVPGVFSPSERGLALTLGGMRWLADVGLPLMIVCRVVLGGG